MKSIIALLLVISLIGCSSSTPDKFYYQLDSDFSNTSVTLQQSPQTIFIEPVSVASYLNKTGIVYQSSNIEFDTASNNLWLTPLSNQIQQRMTQDFSSLFPNYLITTESTSQAVIKIKLIIDAFHGSYTGDAVIKGRWIITGKNNQIITKSFDSLIKLDQDGYSALVKALSKGFQEEEIDLARNIKF